MMWLRLSKSTLELVCPRSCGTCDSASHGRSTTRSKNTSNDFSLCVIFVFASSYRRRPRQPRDSGATRQDSSSNSTGGDDGLPQHLSPETAATATVEAAGLFHVPLRHNV